MLTLNSDNIYSPEASIVINAINELLEQHHDSPLLSVSRAAPVGRGLMAAELVCPGVDEFP